MPSTIPYSPSLVLGSVVHPAAMETLLAMSALQAPVDAAQDGGRHVAAQFLSEDFALGRGTGRILRWRHVIPRQLHDLLRHQVGPVRALEREDHRVAQAELLRTALRIDRDGQVAPAFGQHLQLGRLGGVVRLGDLRTRRLQPAAQQLGQLAVRRGGHHLHRGGIGRQHQLVAQVEAAAGKGRGQDKGKQESGHGHSLGEPGGRGNRH